MKTGRVVTLLEFDVNPFEDFFFSSTRVITSYECSPIGVGSHCSNFPLGLTFPVEGMIVGKTFSITSSSV